MLLKKIIEVKTRENDVRLFLIEEMGSQKQPHHRQLLRETLRDLLAQEYLNSHPPILDLSQSPPQHPQVTISLSHSASASLVGWCGKSRRLGVDIEDAQRPTREAISRVSTPQEMEQAPHFSYLWSAKEAAFKCFSPEFKVIGSVEIVDWKSLNDSSWTFALNSKTGHRGYGELHLIMGHTLAFFTAAS